MLKLTQRDGTPVAVNPEKITHVIPLGEDEGTDVYFDGDKRVRVKERFDDVYAQLYYWGETVEADEVE